MLTPDDDGYWAVAAAKKAVVDNPPVSGLVVARRCAEAFHCAPRVVWQCMQLILLLIMYM